MSKISFTYDEKNSIYINARNNGSAIEKLPCSKYSKNVTDWDLASGVTCSQQEIATIDNIDEANSYVTKIIHINQSEVGDILFRALVQAEDVPGNIGSDWELYADILHHDDTREYSKSLRLPPGKFPWWQFTLNVHSDAGKTIEYIYPYLMLRYRNGKAKFKLPEVIDLAATNISDVSEAYSKPECIYQPANLTSPQGNLKLAQTPFFFADLANLHQLGSPSLSIDILGQFPYLICDEPSDLTEKEKYVTDAIKSTVNIFGYINMSGNPLPDVSILKAAIDRIKTEDWYGVFLDRFGYNYQQTRVRQNEIVDYAHGLGLKCFVYGYDLDETLGNLTDPINNPEGTVTHLGAGDWALLSSFLTDADGYVSLYSALAKYKKAMSYKDSLGIKIGCRSYQPSSITWAQAAEYAALSYLLALIHGFDGWWYVDDLYNDSFRYRPDPNLNLGNKLIRRFDQIAPYWYLAETDKYLIIFDFENYPATNYTVYDKAIKRYLPAGKTVLYSNDLDNWEVYNPAKPKEIGTFVREKTVII